MSTTSRTAATATLPGDRRLLGAHAAIEDAEGFLELTIDLCDALARGHAPRASTCATLRAASGSAPGRRKAASSSCRAATHGAGPACGTITARGTSTLHSTSAGRATCGPTCSTARHALRTTGRTARCAASSAS